VKQSAIQVSAAEELLKKLFWHLHYFIHRRKDIWTGHTEISTEWPTACVRSSREQTLWNVCGKTPSHM